MSTTITTQTTQSHARVLLASLAGTAVEFYDFLYLCHGCPLWFLAPCFSLRHRRRLSCSQPMPALDWLLLRAPSVLSCLAISAIVLVANQRLVSSLLLMGLSTIAVGLLPSYAMAGWLAPLMLCLLRFGQGFGLGGEWAGASLLAVENAPARPPDLVWHVSPAWRTRRVYRRQRIFLSPQPGFDPVTSLRTGGGGCHFLRARRLSDWGLWVRLKLTETPAFVAALKGRPPAKVPLMELLSGHLTETIAGAFAVVACFAVFYLATAFALGYGTGTLGYDRRAFLSVGARGDWLSCPLGSCWPPIFPTAAIHATC